MEFEDETLMERLVGLTEMFPEPVRNFSSAVCDSTINLSQSLFSYSKSALWFGASSFTILILPLIIESERSSIEELQNQQQRQLLLGPSAASTPALGMPGMPFGVPA